MRIPATHSGSRKARIEIIPLIDIMFFLLATFIMVSLSMIKNQGLPVSLPAAQSAKPDEGHASASVSVTKDGQVFWNKEKSAVDQLAPRFAALASDPEARLVIHGDKEADFGLVISVLDGAKKAGLRKTSIRTGQAPALKGKP